MPPRAIAKKNWTRPGKTKATVLMKGLMPIRKEKMLREVAWNGSRRTRVLFRESVDSDISLDVYL